MDNGELMQTGIWAVSAPKRLNVPHFKGPACLNIAGGPVGVCMEHDTFTPLDCTLKSLELVFTYGYSISDYEYIFEQMEMGRISGNPLISHCVSLEELPEMLERLKKPTDQCKVIVMPNKNHGSGHSGLKDK